MEKRKTAFIILTMVFMMILTSCAKTQDMTNEDQKSTNRKSETTAEDTEMPIKEITEDEDAQILMDYEGEEQLEERDVLSFIFPETAEIMGIVATDKEKKTLSLPSGHEYEIISNYCDTQTFTIEDPDQEFIVHVNYNTNEIQVEEN